MDTRIDCQIGGWIPGQYDQMPRECPSFNKEQMRCGQNESCMYQIALEIGNEELASREHVETPTRLATKIELVKSGAERLKDLWSEALYQSVMEALDIAEKYRPGSPHYQPQALDDLNVLTADIVHMQAFGARIATMIGEADGMVEELDAWRHVMHGRKFRTVEESYTSGVRTGRVTDKVVEYTVRCDDEYSNLIMSVAQAKRQAKVLDRNWEGLKELVNVLKYRIQSLLAEKKDGPGPTGRQY